MKTEKPIGLGVPMPTKPLAVILAGGRSARFGRDKAFVTIQGRTFLEILADSLIAAGFEIAISTSESQKFKCYPYPIIADDAPYEGPLYALFSILRKTSSPRILLTACDMPFIPPLLVQWMWEKSRKYDVTILKNEDQNFPLPGVYSRNLLPSIKVLLERGEKSFNALLRSHSSKNIILNHQWSHFDAGERALKNINTPFDFEKEKGIINE